MLTKAQIKRITSLGQKKFRQEHQRFIAEGKKTIHELLQSPYELEQFYGKENTFNVDASQFIQINDKELKQLSFLKTNTFGLAIFKIPELLPPALDGLVVALDAVRDPGNLGTIIRLCDWFGVETILCSPTTVDCYNPKVIQATMGSISRVHLHYGNLETYIGHFKGTVYGTYMDGHDIYQTNLPEHALVVLGNEANGISSEITPLLHHKLTIPRFGRLKETESLNVANATAIVLSEFRRGLTEK